MTMPLTARQVERIKEPGRYSDGNGLYLQVTPSGVRSWILRYERHGRERAMGLGPLHTVSLVEARERARRSRLQLLDGLDPLDARKSAQAAAALEAARSITFEEAATQYFDAHEAKWRSARTREQFLSTMRLYALPLLGRLPVAAVDTGLVLRVLEPIWSSKTETASRVRGRIEGVLDWATVRGYRAGDNPARWRGHLDNVLPAPAQVATVEHHAALPYVEAPAFIQALSKVGGTAARALELTILTAARTGEVIACRWDEFDLRGAVWSVPPGRMKGGREHRVPLPNRGVKLLRMLPRESEFVFPSEHRAHISNMAMAQVLKRMGRSDITVHGFRSTFRDWAAERTNYPNHVVEMALAHAIGDAVEAAYRRGDLFDKRRRLMSEWARYCLTAPVATSTVTPIRRA
jgi:integrase